MGNPATAILLLNVGTPEGPDVSSVRKYLSEFLSDNRVINIPWIWRKLLVNFIILPFRTRKSSELYKRLWTKDGSPLLVHGMSLKNKLQEKLGKDFVVEFAANYQRPGIGEVTLKVLEQNVSRIIAFPLFPQYSSPATGSAIEKLLTTLAHQYTIPAISTVLQYYDNPHYLDAMASLIRAYNYERSDHILMSFHGLPLKQVISSHNGEACEHFDCKNEINDQNQFCYQAACYSTARLLAARINLDESRYTVCFQSRFAGKWLSPFTDEVIIRLAKEGKKQLLVVCPSFTADCLETIIEVGQDYRDLFIKNGGSGLTLVESLNDSDAWVEAICRMISARQ